MKGEFTTHMHGTKNVGRFFKSIAANLPKQPLVFFTGSGSKLGLTE